ncbi:hypothetical protein AVEN_250826-1 [Araneus ventricosus]|uniref:Uncharacterized protein n=1 Tax=Araneus ventricosus TaxID=182803 RepID=A0A4Y2T3J7_ARAVE|nr:hypothetical protein AVEN_250826-1 [Araneus ventricosus]
MTHRLTPLSGVKQSKVLVSESVAEQSTFQHESCDSSRNDFKYPKSRIVLRSLKVLTLIYANFIYQLNGSFNSSSCGPSAQWKKVDIIEESLHEQKVQLKEMGKQCSTGRKKQKFYLRFRFKRFCLQGLVPVKPALDVIKQVRIRFPLSADKLPIENNLARKSPNP